jgi:LuxR family maltose regulon positive regulatory protein
MGHGETAASLLADLKAMAPTFSLPEYQPFRAEHDVRCAIGSVYVALANFDGDAAERELAQAAELAADRPRDALTVKVLAAVAARARRSDRALPLLNEALSLAAMRGCMRLAEDTHPVAVAMRDELAGQPAPPATKPVTRAVPAIATGGLLTPKEAEVLRLVAAGHSNKHIANAMNISDETVKWHLKNLFSKLSAGTRRHAVDRADPGAQARGGLSSWDRGAVCASLSLCPRTSFADRPTTLRRGGAHPLTAA